MRHGTVQQAFDGGNRESALIDEVYGHDKITPAMRKPYSPMSGGLRKNRGVRVQEWNWTTGWRRFDTSNLLNKSQTILFSQQC